MRLEKNKLARTYRATLPVTVIPSAAKGERAKLFRMAPAAVEVSSDGEFQERESHLSAFIRNAPAAIAMFDRSMRYIAASQRWINDYNLAGRDFIGQSHYDLFPEIPERWKRCHRRALAGESLRREEDRFERANGVVQWVHWELRPWYTQEDEIGGVIIFAEDITKRKRAEEMLRHANRTLRVIRGCHQVILRATNEKDLLKKICRIIVETGKERMAWVGFAEYDRRKRVRPVAKAGVDRNFLATARVTWANEPRGRGPVGTAIRTEKTSLCRNTSRDPRYAPWRVRAKQRGYGSIIAFPIVVEGECIGALAIYDREVDAFNRAEQKLLMALVNDLAFGMAMLRLRKERKRLEREILESADREQTRIGRDLHDGLCQVLVGAKFRIVYLERLMSSQFAAAAREANAIERILNDGIEYARDLAHGLNPIRRTPDGLQLALEKLAVGISGNPGIRCISSFPQPVKVTNYETAIHVYRIAQEAAQNAMKHAHAKNISISVVSHNARFTLLVKDDGTGFPAHPKTIGMGLDNMRTRADLIGANLEISRRKSGGTCVKCNWPKP